MIRSEIEVSCKLNSPITQCCAAHQKISMVFSELPWLRDLGFIFRFFIPTEFLLPIKNSVSCRKKRRRRRRRRRRSCKTPTDTFFDRLWCSAICLQVEKRPTDPIWCEKEEGGKKEEGGVRETTSPAKKMTPFIESIFLAGTKKMMSSESNGDIFW